MSIIRKKSRLEQAAIFLIFLFVDKIIVNDHTGQCELHNQYGRNTPGELTMLRLVVPCFHAEQRPNTASRRYQPQQSRFLDTPFRPFGFPLIHTEQKERHHIDDGKVNQDDVNNCLCPGHMQTQFGCKITQNI